MRVVIVGAGIIGCALAAELAGRGVDVVVVDAAQGPAQGATGASFGWLNASFFADRDHFRLRAAGLAAWRDWHRRLELPRVAWNGALWLEAEGAALEAMASSLAEFDYDVDVLDGAELARIEPWLRAPPTSALRLNAEGIAEPGETSVALLSQALARGAKCAFGAPVRGIGPGFADSAMGRFEGDAVVLAAGTAVQALLAPLGHELPMLPRPGVMLRSRPTSRRIGHVLITPEGEIRQDAAGALMMPYSIGRQSDATERIEEHAEAMADDAIARMRRVLSLPYEFDWAGIALAGRPVPEDGLPVIGEVEQGLYVTVMHSGMTLATITAELAADELTETRSNRAELLSPYRPGRFSA